MAGVRVNIKSAVNTKAIRREKRNGKDYIIVPSATLPDDVVMNGIKYPADEIEKGFKTLDRTFAPLGHPLVNGQFISAKEAEAVNDFYVGAHNENVRRENGRVFLDKAIDVEVAGRTEKGRKLLDAINKGEPIHTSTGVYLNTEDSNDPGFSKIARDLFFDHDAILIGEEGAATPSQGVGVFVNSNDVPKAVRNHGDEPVLTINSVVPNACDAYDCDIDWAVRNLVDAVDRQEKAKKTASLADKFVAMIRELRGGDKPKADGLDAINGNEGETMPISDEQFKALQDQVKTLTENAAKIPQSVAEAVTNAVKPLTEQMAAIQANMKADEEAKRSALVDKVVANGLLDKADTEGMSVNALQKLADKIKPGAASPILSGNNQQDQKDHWENYDLKVKE